MILEHKVNILYDQTIKSHDFIFIRQQNIARKINVMTNSNRIIEINSELQNVK